MQMQNNAFFVQNFHLFTSIRCM